MNPAVRGVLGGLAGIISGSLVNFGIVLIGTTLIPVPEGVDAMDPESINQGMHLFGPEHFLSPWLAHALGTLVGAFVATKIMKTQGYAIGLVVGAMFLIGGIISVIDIPQAPMWFKVADLALAYLPMGYLGARLAHG